ncbi:hypothetical protein GJ744_012500 [Endocarpon pusillum]|uniref:Uncharacterized protein n=1 Tax=Endocarpon pusillum TaxID=364733 RepID=A0A8H7AB24_9EURO|nr:hypothetical protein GJ744_012500 [Endocarpon pusillum]
MGRCLAVSEDLLAAPLPLLIDNIQIGPRIPLQQSTYVFPIVGMQTVEHVKAMPEALGSRLSREDLHAIQDATPFNPLFSMNFLFNFKGDQRCNLHLTAAGNHQHQMTSWINAPSKPLVSELLSMRPH